jgi:hypothetical protein
VSLGARGALPRLRGRGVATLEAVRLPGGAVEFQYRFCRAFRRRKEPVSN